MTGRAATTFPRFETRLTKGSTASRGELRNLKENPDSKVR